ncbi:MAG: hypothetical protein K2H09_01700 [Treponemataceae bacterium]|nr:hypothetical protein [Treponemataceae bacterium]
MKMMNVKSVWTAAAVLAFLAAGGAAFAQASEPAAGRGTGLYGYFNDPKVVKGGTVAALSLDAKTGEVSVEIDCGSETVSAASGSGVQFIGSRGRHRPALAACGVRGRSCRDWNPPADTPRHHGWRHEAAERRAYHHPEVGAAECILPDGEPRAQRSGGCPFQIGERVLLIYSADGSSLEAVKGF